MFVNPASGAALRCVKDQFSRRDIKNDLAQRGLRAPVWSFTLGRLMSLPVEKYDSFLRLFDKLNELSKKANLPVLLDLIMPTSTAALSIDLEKLAGNPKAWREIVDYCYKPENGRVNLRDDLVRIHNKYREV